MALLQVLNTLRYPPILAISNIQLFFVASVSSGLCDSMECQRQLALDGADVMRHEHRQQREPEQMNNSLRMPDAGGQKGNESDPEDDEMNHF
jgi:hypothetical protein